METFYKKVVSVLCCGILLVNLAGCGSSNSTDSNSEIKTAMRIGALKGPTGMGMVQVMEKDENGTSKVDYEFTVLESADDIVGKIINGDIDAAAVPTNVALSLYNKTEGAVQLAAVNTLGVLYLLENGTSIQSIADLKGKTVYSSGKGSMPDFIFQHILKENHLTEKDVTIDYKLQHAELATALAAGDVQVALLPQPHVTTAMAKNPGLRIALNITEEWNTVNPDSTLYMGVIVVRKDFAENNAAIVEAFLKDYKESVEFVNEDIDTAAQLIVKHGILASEQVAKKAIPYCNIVFIPAQEAKSSLQKLYQILYDSNPQSVGGKLADDQFYYQP